MFDHTLLLGAVNTSGRFTIIIEGGTERLRPSIGWLVPFFASRCSESPSIVLVEPRGYQTCPRCRVFVLVYRLRWSSGCSAQRGP